jgi:tetratricopeptide (TPR) repeat protein
MTRQIYQDINTVRMNHLCNILIVLTCNFSPPIYHFTQPGSNTLQEQGELDAAVASYQQAIAIKSDYAYACNNLGNALKKQAKLDAAFASYQQALAIKPDYTEALYNLGNTLQEQGKLDRAVASYQQALAIKPDHAETHCNLGNTLREQGKLDAALACYWLPVYSRYYSNNQQYDYYPALFPKQFLKLE